MTSPRNEQRRTRLLAVTACPTGIAHTYMAAEKLAYMAAEKLAQAADALGVEMTVETQGSIGAENVLCDNDVRHADGTIVAADKDVDLSRFTGKRVLTVGVAEGIGHPERLIEQVAGAPVHTGGAGGSAPGAAGTAGADPGAPAAEAPEEAARGGAWRTSRRCSAPGTRPVGSGHARGPRTACAVRGPLVGRRRGRQ